MYTSLTLRRSGPACAPLEGHIYDLSEGGCRFEVDEPIEPGSVVELSIGLPGVKSGWSIGPVRVTAEVLRLEQDDLDSPGPVRTSCAFRDFAAPGDRRSLERHLASGRFGAAA